LSAAESVEDAIVLKVVFNAGILHSIANLQDVSCRIVSE